MTKKRFFVILIDFIAICFLIFVDQLTKSLAVSNLKDQAPFVILKNVFEFHYLENRGAAFGLLQNKKLLFVFMAIIMLTVVCYIIVKIPLTKKYACWHIFLCLISAGGIGNMIDRLSLQYVVDFIYFKLINFPIFNVADIYVTIGTILLFIVILVSKEEDLSFVKFSLRKDS